MVLVPAPASARVGRAALCVSLCALGYALGADGLAPTTPIAPMTPSDEINACCGDAEVRALCFLQSTHKDDPIGALQAAVGCPGAELVRVEVLPEGAPWVLNHTLRLNASDQTVLLQPGVELQARRGLFHSGGSELVSIDNVDNVTLSGYGATLRMWKVWARFHACLHGPWHFVPIEHCRVSVHCFCERVHNQLRN